MPLAVRGLLLGILGILEFTEWVTSPQGWAITGYATIYCVMVTSGLSHDLNTMAIFSVCVAISGTLLFEPKDLHS